MLLVPVDSRDKYDDNQKVHPHSLPRSLFPFLSVPLPLHLSLASQACLLLPVISVAFGQSWAPVISLKCWPSPSLVDWLTIFECRHAHCKKLGSSFIRSGPIVKQPLLKFPAELSYDITYLAVMKLVRPSKKAQLKLVLYYEIPLSAARLFFIVFFFVFLLVCWIIPCATWGSPPWQFVKVRSFFVKSASPAERA